MLEIILSDKLYVHAHSQNQNRGGMDSSGIQEGIMNVRTV